MLIFEGIPSIFNSLWWYFLASFCDIILCPMMPRFIISMRELYDRDLRAHWQGIDTGFGVLSHSIASGNVVVSALAFAEVAPGQGQDRVADGDEDEDDSEAMRLEALGDGTHQVVEGDGDDESKVIRLKAQGDGTCRV